MLRLAKFAFVLASVLGSSCPSASEAGVIPWAYDAIFGPVGSLRGSNYTPYYAGYSGYTGASYQPAAYSYGYATNGCSSCQQSSYYASTYNGCGCSPCGSACSSGGCASGNCASGNCTANSIPTDGLTPVADPNNYGRGTSSNGIESRLEAIEKQLNIVPPRERTRTYDGDGFTRTPTRANDGLGSGSSVPARRRPAAGTGIDEEGYSTPSVRGSGSGAATTRDGADDLYPANSHPANPPARTGTDGAAAGARESFKVNTEKADVEKANAGKSEADKNEADKKDTSATDSTNAADPDLVIPAKKPAATGTAIEGSNRPLTLDSRVTSRAVSPRERQVIAVGFQKSVIASTKPVAPAKAPALSKTAAPAKNWAGNTKSTDLAQHR